MSATRLCSAAANDSAQLVYRRLADADQSKLEKAMRRFDSLEDRDKVIFLAGIGVPLSKLAKFIGQAAAQDDFQFFQQLVRAKKRGTGKIRLCCTDKISLVILAFWDEVRVRCGNEIVCLPGLKSMGDKSAAKLVGIKVGEPTFCFEAYKKRRRRLGLRRDEKSDWWDKFGGPFLSHDKMTQVLVNGVCETSRNSPDRSRNGHVAIGR